MFASHFPKMVHTKYMVQYAKPLSVQFRASWQFNCFRRSSECRRHDIKH